jgi:uncharacterized protein YjbI with pentapeptide repeats
MAIEPKDLDKLQSALNDAAGKAAVLWTTFVTFELYLLIAFGSVTHRNLFLEDPIKLPLFNVDLPLIGFFLVAPAVLVIFHFYVFLQLLGLARKARDYDRVLREAAPAAPDRQLLRQRLDSFLVLQFLAGPTEQRAGFSGLSLRLIAWITLVGGPVLILLQGQLIFLPYHAVWITWFQRIAILIDFAVIWYFWNTVRSEDTAIFSRLPSLAWQLVGGIATVLIVVFSICLATFPGEFVNDHLPGRGVWNFLREPLFAGEANEVSGRPESLFSNRLVLTDQRLVDPDKLDKVEVTHSLRGRDLTAAVLNRADMRKVDFTGAKMDNVRLIGANLQRARFGCAVRGRGRPIKDISDIAESDLECTSLLRAVLDLAEMQGAILWMANLQGASLNYTHMQGANLALARLQNASLLGVQMQGAQLNRAQMQGAWLVRAELQGASLESTELQAASLDEAVLQDASLAEADMRGASLNGAQLQGASFRGAQLQASLLSHAMVWRVRGKEAFEVDLDVDGADPNTLPWKSAKPLNPFRWITGDTETQTTFAAWRDALLEKIPRGPNRDEAKARLSVLDPEMAKEPDNGIELDFWKTLSRSSMSLATSLADLACSTNAAPHAAHGLIQYGRLRSIGPRVLDLEARRRQGNCAGMKDLTHEDLVKFDELVRTARE